MFGNGTALARYYDALTPQERLVLLLQARARGDEREAERLLRTCPRRRYSQREVAFTIRVMMLEAIVWALHWDLGRWLAQIHLLDTVRRLVANPVAELLRLLSWPEAERAELARQAEAWAADTVRQEDAALVDELLDALRRELMGEARIVWMAFGEFCRQELGLVPEVVLSALPHGQNLLELVQEHTAALVRPPVESDELETDPALESRGIHVAQDRVAHYQGLLTTAWRRALPDTQ